MHIDDLKRYLRINRKRLGPQSEDCSVPDMKTQLKADLRLVSQTDKRVTDLVKELKRAPMGHIERPIGFVLLTLLPSLIYLGIIAMDQGWQPLDDLRMPDIQGIEKLANIFTCQFFVCLFLIWTQWNFYSVALRMLIILLCGVLGTGVGIALFGSETTWLVVMLLLILLETFVFRLISTSGVRSSLAVCRKIERKIDEAERDLDSAVQRFIRLGDIREIEQRKMFSEYPCPARICWFAYYRTFDSKHGDRLREPFVRSVMTTFDHPFTEDKRVKFATMRSSLTSQYRIVEQEFGYVNVSAHTVRDWLQKKKIVPFFNWGMPIIPEGLQYRVFRHRWNMYETCVWESIVRDKEIFSSDAQNRFDWQSSMDEIAVFGTTIDEFTWMGAKPELQSARDAYLKRRAEHRESLGSIEVEYDRLSTSTSREHHVGNEIGVLTARAPDGELLGVFCGQSVQSVDFAYRTLREEMGFEFSPTLQANGATQQAILFHRYIE